MASCQVKRAYCSFPHHLGNVSTNPKLHQLHILVGKYPLSDIELQDEMVQHLSSLIHIASGYK